LINTAGSWHDRPDAVTAVENLFLASDYVRTHTDLATMEGANEAARRAVNGILDAAGSSEGRCGVWPLQEPAIFAPARALDRIRFELGRPAKQAVRVEEDHVDASPLLSASAPVAERLERIGDR
jgi:Flavin containing amine oxidoreductase